LALPTLLHGCETWTVREQDKSRMTSVEMKFMRRKAKYTWQDYKTMKIFSELKINPVVKKIKITEMNGYNMFGEWTEPVTITKYQPCGKRSQGLPLIRLLDC
jgi:hypothetical protein